MTTLIKLKFSTADRFSQSRTFKTLKGAQKYAHSKVGQHPDISLQFQYAVGMYGDAKLEIREGTTFAELFPGTAGTKSDDEMYENSVPVGSGTPVRVSPNEAWRTFNAGGRDLQELSVVLIHALIAGCRTSSNEASVALLKACEAELARRGE